MTKHKQRMRIRILVRMRAQFKRCPAPEGCYYPGLHLGERPGNGFGVEQQACKSRVGEVEELVGVEVVDAFWEVSMDACYIGGGTYGVRLLVWPDRLSSAVVELLLMVHVAPEAEVLCRMEHLTVDKTQIELRILWRI